MADSLVRKAAQPWDRIWLQFYGADWEELHGDTEPADEMTWAQNKINDSDVEYVRAEALAPMREALQAIVDDAKNRNEPGGTWVLVAGGLIDRAAEVLKGDEI